LLKNVLKTQLTFTESALFNQFIQNFPENNPTFQAAFILVLKAKQDNASRHWLLTPRLPESLYSPLFLLQKDKVVFA